MVTGSLDARYVRDTATADLDRRIDEDAVDPPYRLDGAVRVRASAGRSGKRVGIAACKGTPRRPIGLFVDVAGNDDRRAACRGARHDFVDMPAALIAVEIEVNAAK